MPLAHREEIHASDRLQLFGSHLFPSSDSALSLLPPLLQPLFSPTSLVFANPVRRLISEAGCTTAAESRRRRRKSETRKVCYPNPGAGTLSCGLLQERMACFPCLISAATFSLSRVSQCLPPISVTGSCILQSDVCLRHPERMMIASSS